MMVKIPEDWEAWLKDKAEIWRQNPQRGFRADYLFVFRIFFRIFYNKISNNHSSI